MSSEKIRYYAAAQLRKRFLDGGKSQITAFDRLSQIIERYVTMAKERGGERSGAMNRAFGDELVRMKGRFTARQGVPPRQIYRTPDAWLRVITGLAREVGENGDIAIIKALEAAFAPKGESVSASDIHWSDELPILVQHMGEKLRSEADLVGLTDYVARAGLIVEDGAIRVNEWPMESGGFVDGDLYDPIVLALVPHTWGINFRPVNESHHDVPVSVDEWAVRFPEFAHVNADVRAAAATVSAFAGVRIGACFTVNEERGEPEFGLLEWHHAELSILDETDKVLANTPTRAEFADMREALAENYAPGVGANTEAVGRPSNWIPGSVRFHFVGSAGFARVAQSLIVRPWIWTDRLEADFWAPDPTEPNETPVAAPRHTVAAAIEGNLLYADAADAPEMRLDRLLAREIGRVSRSVEAFRRENQSVREARRAALLADWGTEDQ